VVRPGHRTLPHTADLLIEAWAPTRAECLAETVRALAEAVADVRFARPEGTVAFRVTGPDDPALLRDLLEEVVVLVEVEGVVPAAVSVVEDDGALLATLGVVPLDRVETVGPAPKAVTRHQLALEPRPDGWHSRVLVDV